MPKRRVERPPSITQERKSLPEFPRLRSLQAPRHPGVTRAVCQEYAEAAEVCLSRHHSPPSTRFATECLGVSMDWILRWRAPSDTALRAHNNRDDATRDGAYGLVLAAIEAALGLVAIGRVEIRKGADWYVGVPGSLDFEDAYRLEISGVDAGELPAVKRRLREKEQEAASGESSLPAIAGVVGFRVATVLISRVEEP